MVQPTLPPPEECPKSGGKWSIHGARSGRQEKTEQTPWKRGAKRQNNKNKPQSLDGHGLENRGGAALDEQSEQLRGKNLNALEVRPI